MSEILNRRHKRQLSKWIGKSCHFKLLYKISKDGCSPETFHTMCDNKGPTVTVLYNDSKSLYGAYLSQNWHESSGYIYDESAFLFRLQFNGLSTEPIKFDVKDPSQAAYGSSSYGPAFGGDDLYTYSSTIYKSGDTFNLNGSLDIGTIYNSKGYDIDTIANGNMNVKDLEVYVVKESGPFALLDIPWRKGYDWSNEDLQHLQKIVADYVPPTQSNVEVANILLIGQIGAGKSSFINSVEAIFDGNITGKAMTGSLKHSVTIEFRKYAIAYKDDSLKTNLKFKLCDTQGIEDEFLMSGQEMAYILDGNVPDRYQFNQKAPFSTETLGFLTNPSLGDKIHCAAFVIDGSTIDVISEKVLQRFKDLRYQMIRRNLPNVVLMTKPDLVCSEVNDDLSTIFKSTGVRDTLNTVAELMEMQHNHVLPIKNYEKETELDPNIDILILKALKQTTKFATNFIEDQMAKITLKSDNK